MINNYTLENNELLQLKDLLINNIIDSDYFENAIKNEFQTTIFEIEPGLLEIKPNILINNNKIINEIKWCYKNVIEWNEPDYINKWNILENFLISITCSPLNSFIEYKKDFIENQNQKIELLKKINKLLEN